MQLFLCGFLCVLFLWVGPPLTAAHGQSAAPTAEQRPLADVRVNFADEDIGYLLFDLEDGHTIEAHRPHEPRIPASTAKVVTTVAALQILGAEYRFSTVLFTTGEVRDGALSGNLYLRGGGDPTLSTDDLREFVAVLQRAGVKRVTGSFIYDESLLPSTQEIEPRQPVAVSYNPGVSALSVNYNRIQLRWKRKPGATAFSTAIFSPADGGLVPVNAISAGSLPANLDRQIKFLPDGAGTDRWLLSPFLPSRGQEELPVKTNPGKLTALLFRTLCQQRGIVLPLPDSGVTPAHARPLYTHDSAPLPTIITTVLRYSNNLAAELIGQLAARRLNGKPARLRESAAALADWYSRMLSQADWRGFVSVNHSGLSSVTRHTPQQLAEILLYAWRHQLGGARFSELLSPPHWGGEDDSRIREMVRAKSGAMNYADGLIGYLTTARGRQLGFVIMLTDFDKRAALDAHLDVRVADPSPEARAWTQRAKFFEKSLIMQWIRKY